MLEKLKKLANGKEMELYREEIYAQNSRNMFYLCLFVLALSVGAFLAAVYPGSTFGFEKVYILIFSVTSVFTLFSRFVLPKYPKLTLPSFYLLIALILYASILTGTKYDPTHNSLNFMVFLCVLPSFIIDKHWRLNTLIGLSTVVLIIYTLIYKEPTLARSDIGNACIFTTISMLTHTYLTNTKFNSIKVERMLKIKARTDSLTKLLNRTAGVEAVSDILASDPCGVHAFFLLDIDRFKEINDSYGHAVGDEVIHMLSLALINTFPARSVIYRLGGDEFCVLVPNIKSREECERYSSAFNKTFSKLVLETSEKVEAQATVGCAVYPDCGSDYNELYFKADKAMYRAKHTSLFEFAK